MRSDICLVAPLLLALTPGVAKADAVSDFYKNRTVDVVIGSPAGGGYDTYGRLIALHLGDHIPGNPRVVPQNMTGAGGLRAANHIYNTARKDGTEIGIVASSTLMKPLFGDKTAQFDPAKFAWLGSANQIVAFCGVDPRSQVTSFTEWLRSGKELKLASSGVGAASYQHPLVMKSILGANAKIITGYSGAGEFMLAVQRGEIDGFCGMDLASIGSQYKPVLDAGGMKLIVQMGPHKDNTFGPIESAMDYAKTDEQREILSVAFDQLALGRPFMAPPSIPAERFAALTKAFIETLKDPALLSEAERMKLDVDYLSGEEIQNLLKRFANYPPDVLQKAKDALGE